MIVTVSNVVKYLFDLPISVHGLDAAHCVYILFV